MDRGRLIDDGGGFAARRRTLLRWCCAAAAGPLVARAAAAPICGQGPPPAYPAPDQPVIVESWLAGGRRDGPPPDCGGLASTDFELLVRLTASYASGDDLDQQLVRFGAVSQLRGMRYWSFSDHRRQTLIHDAYAVQGIGTPRARPDFSPAELKSGAELAFLHNDNRSGQMVPYRMRLLRHGADGFVLRVENAGDISMWGMTLVASREMQWAVSVERLGPGRWGYRSLLGLHSLRMGSAQQHRLSNLSRAVAMFDLVSGRQTEVEPYR